MKKLCFLFALIMIFVFGNANAKSMKPPKAKAPAEVTDVEQADEATIESEQKANIAEEEASQAEEKVEMSKEEEKEAEEKAEAAEKERIKEERIAEANKKYEESVKNAEAKYSENVKSANEKADRAKLNAENDFTNQTELANSKHERAIASAEKATDETKKSKMLEKADAAKTKSIDKAETKKVKAIEKAEDAKVKELEVAEATKQKSIEQAQQIKDLEIDAAEKGVSPKKVKKEEEKLIEKEAKEDYGKGWHQGGFLYAMGGLAQVDHDKNLRTNRTFGSKWNWGFGLTAGYDFVDWLGFMFQAQYSSKSAEVGNGTPDYPTQNGKEHAATIRPTARFTLTQITNWVKFPSYFVVVPYVKLGGAAHALYIHANAAGNKTAAWGGGMSVGGGLELIFWKRLVLGVDVSEDMIWLQSYSADVAGTRVKIIEGGFRKMFNVMGMLGVHF